MGGGFGLNLGKRGVSWSVRGKGGSFGSKGISVRTGLKGLSYQQRYKKNGGNYSTYYPRQRFTRAERNYANTIILIGITILLLLFNIGTDYIIGIIFVIIVYKIYKYYKKRNLKKIVPIQNSNSIITSAKFENVSPKYEVEEKVQTSTEELNNYYSHVVEFNEKKEISLEFSQLITLENICIELLDLTNQIIVEKNSDLKFFERYSEKEIKFLILHDICNIFHLFDTSINVISMERQLWFSTISYFTQESTNFAFIQETEIKKTIQNLISPDFFVFSDIGKVPFTALIELKKYNSKLYNLYKSQLRAYIALIATIDFKLSTQEEKLIAILNKL